MSTYRVITSDGKKHQFIVSSAAEAIEEARWMFRGLTVKECYSGVKPEDAEMIRAIDHTARPIVGWVNHEIPDHGPIAEGLVRVRPKHATSKTINNIPLMFNDDDIIRESENAKRKL